MHEVINEKVSVATLYDRTKNLNMPVKLRWQGKTYTINKLGFHHKYRQGRTLMHVFSVSNSNLAFRLEFDSDTLTWTLKEISDGLAD